MTLALTGTGLPPEIPTESAPGLTRSHPTRQTGDFRRCSQSGRFGVRFPLDQGRHAPVGKREQMDNTMIGYTRVSTEEQGRSGLGLDAQRSAIERFATAHEKRVLWITDEGVSAKSMKRPGIQTALWLLAEGDADGIVVSKLDRLSRSVQDFANVLADAKRQRWSLTALDIGMDTSTSGGELMANVMAAVAQWERDVISERTSAALRAAQARGVHVGRPTSLSKDAEVRLYELRALGFSHARVAAQLNAERVPTAHGGAAWHATTVARILNRQSAGRID